MCLKTVGELQQDQELLRMEVSQLKSQMNHIMGVLEVLLKGGKISPPIIAPEVHAPIAQRQYYPVVAQVEAYGLSPMDLPQPSFSKIPDKQSLSIPRQSEGYQWQGKKLNKTLRKQQKMPRRFDTIPMPYTELYPVLIQNSLVAPRPTQPAKFPFPKEYDPNVKCDFHSGISGHSIEDCNVLKEIVQDLVDDKILLFKDIGLMP